MRVVQRSTISQRGMRAGCAAFNYKSAVNARAGCAVFRYKSAVNVRAGCAAFHKSAGNDL